MFVNILSFNMNTIKSKCLCILHRKTPTYFVIYYRIRIQFRCMRFVTYVDVIMVESRLRELLSVYHIFKSSFEYQYHEDIILFGITL